MTQPTDEHHVLAAIIASNHGPELAAWAPDRGLRTWPVPPANGELDTSLREFLNFVGKDLVVCFQADELAELLSRPAVLPFARRTLGRLVNLREAALILLPCECQHTLEALSAAAQSVPRQGRTLLPQDLQSCEPLAHTLVVLNRLRTAVAQAPQVLMAALHPLLGNEPTFAWLPWPQGAAEVADLLRVDSLLPGRPPGRRRDSAAGDLPGDLRDLAMAALAPGGCVEEALPAYEYRPGQVEMAGAVALALRDERFLLVEAGTGVGKSLAYLIPAILWARRTGEPVVVSTNTKNLQEQLIAKDLPLLQQALPLAFEVALVKGRANYPCLRMLAAAAVDAANSLVRGDRLAAAYLVSWLASSPTHDLDEITPDALQGLPELSGLITRVRSQADACPGRACSHYDACPVETARALARRADIIVSNHALTFADTQVSILPQYSRLILDEAQNIEAVATDALGMECSSYTLAELLRTLAGGPASFVQTMLRRLQQLGDAPGLAEAKVALQAIPDLADEWGGAVNNWGEMLYAFCFAFGQDGRSNSDRAAVRLRAEARSRPEWEEITAAAQGVLLAGAQLLTGVEAFASCLAQLDKGALPGAEGLDADAAAMRGRIASALETIAAVLQAEGEHPQYVTWAEAWQSRWGPSWSLHAAPVDIGGVLSAALYEQKAAIVMTSATLTVDGDFAYFRQRVGLTEHHDKLVELSVPSPFQLTEQLLLCVPADMPEPNAPEFHEAVIAALRGICEVTEGGTLALFTARTRMVDAYQRLRPDLERLGLTPLCQDLSGSRSHLLDRLRGDPSVVLFGLKSFWEGVDVPGDALRCVVITKLPFAVPTDPIIQARQEDVARKGLDPMRDYYIPEAVVGFKQGLGRLIRTRTDTGVVFVLDRRLLTKSYGRRFFRSIQRCEFSRDPLEQCLAQAQAWLGKR